MPTPPLAIAQLDAVNVGGLLPDAAIFAALVLLHAILAASEGALIGFSKIRRRQLVEEEHPRIGAVEKLLEKPSRFVLAVIAAKTLLVIAATAVATVAAFGAVGTWGEILVIIVAGVVFVAAGEVLPKAFAVRYAERLSLLAAPAMRVLVDLLAAPVWLFERVSRAAFRATGTDPDEGESRFRSEEELKTLITLGTEEGILEEEEEEMIHSVIEFGDITAREVMVPRPDMVAVPGDATLDHVRMFVLDSGYSRLPVYQGSVDNVVGIVIVKEILLALLEGKGSKLHVRDLMKEAYFVPETKKLDDLLSELRERRVHMAIVIDEFGGTAGLVTLEDVLEEIVGDIFDETDLRREPISVLDESTAVVEGRTHVADVNEKLGLSIPEDEPYETVAGYVSIKLGRLAKEGEAIEGEGFTMTVEKVVNRRIVRVRIVKRPASPAMTMGEQEPEAGEP
ncbi:MAG TPA: hemolysin family protein [Candidatus Thermoplasmatota archaeon]|nr:hemolysin family protein [Candidatus Thermoplasmatota archaeon]